MYIYILPLLYSSLKVKQLFFFNLNNNLCIYNLFLELNSFIDLTIIKKILIKYFKNIFFIRYSLMYQKMIFLIK